MKIKSTENHNIRMTLQERIKAFALLGDKVAHLNEAEIDELYFRATAHNNWFTRDAVAQALEGIAHMLKEDKLIKWTSPYELDQLTPRTVAIIMAGNIPLVGFHDYLAVLLAGHSVKVKLSSQDPYLIQVLNDYLTDIEPGFEGSASFTKETLNGFDAVIATGSDNSSRYFEYYFGKYPNIIRKNRTSIAVLDGSESEDEIKALGEDIFQYYGLGCRNVSKLLLPKEYPVESLLEKLEPFKYVLDHHKWSNNYDYNKSIFLVNGDKHFDTGFSLFKESDQLVSPISVIFYEFYEDSSSVDQFLQEHTDKLQCIVGKKHIPFGKAQKPELWDYADNVDTLDFLQNIR